MKPPVRVSLCVAALLVLGCGATLHAQTWGLVWSDELNGSGAVSGTNWTYDVGGGGWGNGELEYYQSGNLNANQAGGILTIQARQQSVGGMPYTSARLKTQGVRSFGPYGKMEARIAGPNGAGLWPAFWMLGTDIATIPWPDSGEIDIMEHINSDAACPTTIHWNSGAGHASWGPAAPACQPFTSYHTFAITWTNTEIRWWLDGVTNGFADIANNINSTNEFHRPYFAILNLAVGGAWPGNPSGATVFPANLNVDYVRWYQAGVVSTPTPTTPSATATPTTPSRATPTATAAPGGLVSQGKPATASSSENAGTTPNFAVDGNTGTRWSSAFSDPQWMTVDLGATYTISRVRITWEAAYATAYQILVSSNNSTFTNVVSVTGADGGIDDHNVNASGRYLRVNCTARATQYGCSFWELEVFGTLGTATPTSTTPPRATATATTPARSTPTTSPAGLLSQGRPAVSSSNESATFPAGSAVDGNTGTRWASAFSDPQWIYVDLGAPRNITRVILNWEAAYGTAYQLQSSNDAVSWSTFYSTTTGNGGLDDVTVAGSGRYVRMNGTARATQWGYSLWEFQVYGN